MSGTRLGTNGSLPRLTRCERSHLPAGTFLLLLCRGCDSLLAIARAPAAPPQLPPDSAPGPPHSHWAPFDPSNTERERERDIEAAAVILRSVLCNLEEFRFGCGFGCWVLMNWSAGIAPSSLPWLWTEWTCRSYGWPANLVVVVGG